MNGVDQESNEQQRWVQDGELHPLKIRDPDDTDASWDDDPDALLIRFRRQRGRTVNDSSQQMCDYVAVSTVDKGRRCRLPAGHDGWHSDGAPDADVVPVRNGNLWECTGCGAAVLNVDLHIRWHEATRP